VPCPAWPAVASRATKKIKQQEWIRHFIKQLKRKILMYKQIERTSLEEIDQELAYGKKD
jgi:hypothetical protein